MRKLYRSRRDFVLAGICGGFGDYWGIDPVFIRLVVIFISIMTAILPMLLLYFICCFVIPRAPEGFEGTPYPRIYRSRKDRRIAGICGGIAQFFNIDSTILRLIIVVVAVLTAIIPLLISYIVGWLIIPEEP